MSGRRLPGLRAELVRRAARQQAVRHGVDLAVPTAEEAELIQTVDEDNVAWFATVVAAVGWPGRRQVGIDGSFAAFMLARRAPVQFRAAWLPIARTAASRRDASKRAVQILAEQVEVDRRTTSVR